MIGDFLSCLKVKNFLSVSILHGSVTSHFLLRLEFSSWSNWSSCDGECGRHGMRNRSKDCYGDGMIWNTTLNCTHFSDEKYEEDEQCYMDHYPCYSKYFILLIYKSKEWSLSNTNIVCRVVPPQKPTQANFFLIYTLIIFTMLVMWVKYFYFWSSLSEISSKNWKSQEAQPKYRIKSTRWDSNTLQTLLWDCTKCNFYFS